MIHAVRNDPSVIALVERARNGDQAAWNRIVERYAPLVWSICRRFDLTGTDAEDVGSSVWFLLYKNLGTIRESAALPGWLATTTRRECLHLLRIKNREVPVADHDMVDQDVADTGPAPDEWLLVQERHIALRSAFARLSARCQQLLSLLFSDPPTPYADVGTTLGIPAGTIGPTRQRCLETLRRSPEIAALRDPATSADLE